MGSVCEKPQKTTVASGATPEQISEFVAKVRPLDLLVFRGAEGVSNAITKLEKLETGSSAISHVEVAITREWCAKIKSIRAKTKIADTDHTLFSWGSTMSGPLNDKVDNAETGGSTFGVQIRVLEDLVREYVSSPGANVGVCRLLDNPTEKRRDETVEEYALRAKELKKKIAAAYDEYNGRQYDANPIALLGSLFPSLRPLRNATEEVLGKFSKANSWLFCSEFAAALYVYLGIINDETDGVVDGKAPRPEDVVPVDFLGVDEDKNGIVKPICEIPPVWVKD